MEALYPHKIEPTKLILAGKSYSLLFTVVNPEGLSEDLIKQALDLVVGYCYEYYDIEQSHWHYFAGFPALFEFFFKVRSDPGETLGEFAQRIREFGIEYNLDLALKDAYIWKPSKWPLIVLGGLALLTLGLCLRKEK